MRGEVSEQEHGDSGRGEAGRNSACAHVQAQPRGTHYLVMAAQSHSQSARNPEIPFDVKAVGLASWPTYFPGLHGTEARTQGLQFLAVLPGLPGNSISPGQGAAGCR